MLKPSKNLNFSTKFEGYAYQVEAVEAVKNLEFSALFHEQGLGKTKMGIDLALEWIKSSEVDSVMIVTKRSLIQNWLEEIESHSHIYAKVLGQDRKSNFYALNSPARIYLIHYEAVKSEAERLELFLQTRRVAVILDESQKIKNPASQLTQVFHKLSEYFARRVIMTGTPVANRPEDIWSQIYFLDKGKALGTDFEVFKQHLQLDNDLHSDIGRQTEFSSELSSVFQRISSFTVRETKDSAGIELPKKIVTTVRVFMEPLQGELYTKFREDLYADVIRDGELVADDVEAVLKRLLRLVQVASSPNLVDESYTREPGKITELRRLVNDAVAQGTKVIVWTSFVANVEWLCADLKEYGAVPVHGGLDMETRNESISSFKQDKNINVLVATPGAAKEGLTLTMASHAIFYDRSFSLDDYLQAQDRIHRISQDKTCHIWNLICCDTVDEWVNSLLAAKRLAAQLLQADIDKEEYERLANYQFGQTISEILNPNQKVK